MTNDEAPRLADLMPWSVAAPRLGRSWPLAPDPDTLGARWDALTRARGAERAALFEVSRARDPHSAVAQLPGRRTSTARLARDPGPLPGPLRVLCGPFDEQWLLPDHRLIDAARPELWRVADQAQLFAVEQRVPSGDPGPALLVSALLPVSAPASGPAPRVRPLFRRPGGTEPNLAPGLLGRLADRLGGSPAPVDVLAWIVAYARPAPGGCAVPLTTDAGAWARGTATGHRMLRVMCRPEGGRPKLPGGRRPYIRVPLPDRPGELRYDREGETLCAGEGRISPVPAGAWDFTVGGTRVLESWFAGRTVVPEGSGALAAIRAAGWQRSWTSELLELITVLALLAELRASVPDPGGAPLTAAELRGAGVLPPPEAARRPASVLDHHEEGPEGQFALL